MLNVYTIKDRDKWNDIVKSFRNWDVYYLYEYAHSFMIHGDGEPLLIDYADEESHVCYVVMQSDIASSGKFENLLEKNTYFDWETPYGYGGPLSDSMVSEKSQNLFLAELSEYCKENGVVSQFVRFHPVLGNDKLVPKVIEPRYLRDTIYIDTSSEALIMQNMDTKNRNMVRKAVKNGVTIEERPVEDYKDFISMYEQTMLRDNADEYYMFDDEYFKSQSQLSEYASLFYAVRNGRRISGAIMYYNNRFMHYHLSGTFAEERSYSPGNLLLYEAACRASKMGISKFHLGGGIEPDDSLFSFKKKFNKNGRLQFVVGRTIFNENGYEDLMKLRKQADEKFDIHNNRMIQYRR